MLQLSKALIVGAILASLIGPVRANSLAYATTGNDYFGVVDLNTGVFTPSGNMGLRLTGLGVGPGGTLYGGAEGTGTLYSVNPLNGALTTIGTGAIDYWATGSTTSGLYAVDPSSNMNLYSINPTTGAATLIGPTGLSPNATVEGMSTGSGSLYFTVNSSLYVLNTTTGAATLVGTSASGLFGPMVLEGGTLYTGAAGPDAIWTLSLIDGSGTFVANESGDTSNFWGLAPDPNSTLNATPLPPAWTMMLIGLAAFGLCAHRASKRLSVAAIQ
jgi:hypothetical protein